MSANQINDSSETKWIGITKTSRRRADPRRQRLTLRSCSKWTLKRGASAFGVKRGGGGLAITVAKGGKLQLAGRTSLMTAKIVLWPSSSLPPSPLRYNSVNSSHLSLFFCPDQGSERRPKSVLKLPPAPINHCTAAPAVFWEVPDMTFAKLCAFLTPSPHVRIWI